MNACEMCDKRYEQGSEEWAVEDEVSICNSCQKKMEEEEQEAFFEDSYDDYPEDDFGYEQDGYEAFGEVVDGTETNEELEALADIILASNPKGFHAVNQPLLDSMYDELQNAEKGGEPGKFGSDEKPPMCFVAVDQGLVNDLHSQIRNKLGL